MNILGEAKSYLEERGIDTSMMTEEEIIQKYYELIAEEVISEEVDTDTEEVDNEEVVDSQENNSDEEGQSPIDAFLEENAEVISTLNEEQKAIFDKLIELLA